MTDDLDRAGDPPVPDPHAAATHVDEPSGLLRQAPNERVHTGQATGAGGGYGSGSGVGSSGGTGDATRRDSGPDANETEWLRRAPGGPPAEEETR